MNPYRENRLHTFVIKSSIFLAIAYVILTAFAKFLGDSDIPMPLRWLYGFALFAWFIWTVATVFDHQRQVEHEKTVYNFNIKKTYSVSCCHPSSILPARLDISTFMDAYNMTERDFHSKIVLHGIQLAIQEYVDEHPEKLEYSSGLSIE